MKRYISYILTVALLLLLGGSVVMACNNCSSLKWTVLEIHSQEELAKVLEQVNLSEVQEPSVPLTNLLNEVGADQNCTAYLLIPASSEDLAINETVEPRNPDQCGLIDDGHLCSRAKCPRECPNCADIRKAYDPYFDDGQHDPCKKFQHLCCKTGNHIIIKDKHGCNTGWCL